MSPIKPLFLCIALLFASGCSDKKEKTHTPQKLSPHAANEKNATEQNTSSTEHTGSIPKETALLENIKNETHSVLLEGNRFIISDVKQPIVLVNFFSTWCPPCRGQLPYFEDLQKKYPEALFVTGILVNDDANTSRLEAFYKTYHMDYFVASSSDGDDIAQKVAEALDLESNFILPLTVLYKKGAYYTHYEGPVPVEMIDHDIRMALDEK